MAYKRYEKYKDSGVEWIGEIPEEWELSKIKFQGNVVGRIGFKGYSKEDLVNKEYGALTLGAKHIKDNKIYLEDPEYISWAKYHESPEIMIKLNDILVTQRGSIGKIAIIESKIGEATINPSVVLIKKVKCINKYLYYILISDYVQKTFDSFLSSTAVPMISQEQLNNLEVLVPSKIEQNQIAIFLDKKASEIDALISDKVKLIELLKEKRQAIITETVTKGLNPNVKMKDSGVQWIGEIPEHWEKTKLKYVTTQIIDGTHSTPNYISSGIPFLRVTDITAAQNGREIDLEKVNFISEEEHKELIKRCNPKKGDVLVSKNGTIGIPKVVDWDFEFSIFVSLCLIKLRKSKIDEYFCSYFFESSLVDEQIAYGGKKSTIVNLHLDKMKEFMLFLPPLNEQKEIVNNLNLKLKEIDYFINISLASKELLERYKQSLISEAVTGKIDVRELV